MSKKQEKAGYPGIGKSKLSKTLAKKLGMEVVDVAKLKNKFVKHNCAGVDAPKVWLGTVSKSAITMLHEYDGAGPNPYIFDPGAKTNPVQPRSLDEEATIQICSGGKEQGQ